MIFIICGTLLYMRYFSLFLLICAVSSNFSIITNDIVFNWYFLLITSCTLFVLNCVHFILKKLFYKNETFFYTFLKVCTLISFLVSFMLHCFIYGNFFFSFNLEAKATVSLDFLSTYYYCKNYFFSESIQIDLFALTLVFLAYTIGFLTLIMSDVKISKIFMSKYLYLNFFVLIVHGFVFSTSMLNMFVYYELLLIPSLLFIVYVGYTQRSMQSCVYFVLWTQFGSLLVLIAIVNIYYSCQSFSFFDATSHTFTKNESTYLFFLIFLGFGIKIPIWPAHYWLTKTHVEASSSFSIFLSGFLVKSALFGFYKFTNILNIDILTSWCFVIAAIGCIDSSLKMWGQTDLKKLVAYCTIQEMNLILLCFCLGNSYFISCGVLFCLTHAFLSALMFFIVDCIYKRFHSRSIVNVFGLAHLTPNLSVVIFFMTIFFSGVPGTLKFLVEINLYCFLFEISQLLTIVLIFAINFIGLLGFCKCWFNVLFGFNKKQQTCIVDLTKKEIYIAGYCFFFLTFFNMISISLL